MNLWLPETAQADAERLAMIDRGVTETGIRVTKLNRELKALDEHCSFVYFGDDANAPGIVPGRWHIRRKNPRTVDTYIPLQGEKGEYREPESSDIERLKGADLHRKGAFEQFRNAEIRRERIQEKLRAERREQRREEFAAHIHAANPGVSFTSAGPWTYRAGARHA